MNTTQIQSALTLGDALELSLTDRRPESRDFFSGIATPHRPAVAADVWQIGLRALQTAQASANAARLEDIGGELLGDLKAQLTEHVTDQQTALDQQLQRYFDPADGRLMARLDALFRDEGQLVALLKRHTGSGSALATTLTEKLQPLLRALDPAQRDGAVQALARQVEEVLKTSERSVAEALDPLRESSAAGRFLGALRREITAAGETQEKQLAAATAALDANNPDSLLSRLLRETREAQERVLAAVTPGAEGSLLGPLQQSLTAMLEAHQRQVVALQESQRQRQEAFERDMREAIQRIEMRREHLRRGAEAGRRFEECVHDYASQLLRGGPVVVDFTGNKKSTNGRKVGDVVLSFTDESAYAGVKIVIEAKCEANYSVEKALAELAEARKNRDAAIGVFVLSGTVAPPAFPPFGRYGHDVLVVWNSEDPTTDAYLHAALLVGMALASRTSQQGEVDVDAALGKVLAGIEEGVKRIVEIDKKAKVIASAANAILEEVRRGQVALEESLGLTRALLDAGKAARADAADEAKSPIVTTIQLGAEGLGRDVARA